MGNLLGTQRYAIEKVAENIPITLSVGQRYFLGAKEVFLRGVSVGSKIYSDISNADIAVFGEIPSPKNVFLILGSGSRECRGGVFVRKKRDDESDVQKVPGLDIKYLAIEGLVITVMAKGQINFAPNRKVGFYVHLEGAAR